MDDPDAMKASQITLLDGMYRRETRVLSLLRSLRGALEAGALGDLWLESKLQEMVVQILAAHRDAKNQADYLSAAKRATRIELHKRLRRGRDYIDACCGQPLSLTLVARVAAMSPFHFSRAFKEAFSNTPHTYLINRRIERAKWLLTRSPDSITRISMDLGFSSPGALSNAFRRHVGLTPSSYRRSHARSIAFQ